MEVHKHPHHVTHKKKWGEYLLEFFMLFLAVFMGFMVENYREHYIENVRAEELAKTLYGEMKSDSINLSTAIANRKDKETHLEYVAQYFQDSNLTNLSTSFYPRFTWAVFMNSYIVFEPKDGMLEQLKNSGSLRYFKNKSIQRAVGDFSVAIKNLRTRSEREGDLLATINRDFLLKYYDFTWLNKITNNGEMSTGEALKKYSSENKIIPASINGLGAIDRKATPNYLNYYVLVLRSTRLGQITEYQKVSNNLIKLLREEYHLENE
jgi:hypothetical protein